MSPEPALSKRIKRHVIGRIRKYFISVSPGFEKLCYDELVSLPLSVKNARIVKGGIEFDGRLTDCFVANLNLRLATRILMRIDSFKAENFRKFKKKMGQIPWEIYLHQGDEPVFHITTSHSRLYHKGAICERSRQAIAERFGRYPGLRGRGNAQAIHIKSENNIFTVSLDSSGDLLYKRGIKTHGGKAPLRETTSAAILKMAGYNPCEPLVDPMCGSGTFALEGAMAGNRICPGMFRKFAFMGWPGFPQKRWAYIKKESGKMRIFPDKPYIFAIDKDETACNALCKTVKNHGLDDTIIVRQENFFSFSPEKFTNQKGLVAINPPYGKRMGKAKDTQKLFMKIFCHLKDKYKGWKLALIVPDKTLMKSCPFKMDFNDFFHGGMKLNLIVGKIY